MPSNWIQTLDPVFTSIRQAITRSAAKASKDTEDLRAHVADLERRLHDAETLVRDAVSAVDVTRAEVELIRNLYATQTRETGELVRHCLSMTRPQEPPPARAPAPALVTDE